MRWKLILIEKDGKESKRFMSPVLRVVSMEPKKVTALIRERYSGSLSAFCRNEGIPSREMLYFYDEHPEKIPLAVLAVLSKGLAISLTDLKVILLGETDSRDELELGPRKED